MADRLEVDLIVKALTQGFDKIKTDLSGVGDTVEDTGKGAKNAGMRFTELASQLSVAKQAFSAVAGVAKVAYSTISEGAALNQAQSQFENLAGSIGTTAESIDTKLKAATNGMMSQAERMSGASQIISLGLAQNEEDVVRLAKATGTLGLDMQQVILTFANNSKARLDALGLSVEGVTQKAAELEAQGFKGDAFDEAVLIGLEEKMTLLGDASETTAGQLKRLESDWADLTNQAKQYAATVAGPVVASLTRNLDQFALLKDALEKGIITQGEYNKAVYVLDEEQRAGFIEETTRAMEAYNEVVTISADEMERLAPAIMEAADADRILTGELEKGTQEIVARTEEAVRGAGGMEAYRMGVERSLSTEEAMAVSAANTAAAINAVNEATGPATAGIGGMASQLTGATDAAGNLLTPLQEIQAAMDALNQEQTAAENIINLANNQDIAASSAVVLEEKLTGVYTGLEDTGSQAVSSSGMVQDYIAKLGEIPAEVSTQLRLNISTSGGGAYYGGNVGEQAANTYAGGSTGDRGKTGEYGYRTKKVDLSENDFDPSRKFAMGGIVPGPIGSPQVILAHGGETVIPTGQNGGSSAATPNNNFYISGANPQEIASQVSVILAKQARMNSAAGVR